MTFGLMFVGLVASYANPSDIAKDKREADLEKPTEGWIRPLGVAQKDQSFGLLYERWNGLQGKKLSRGMRADVLSSLPDREGIIEAAQTVTADGKDFLVRTRGYFTAPRSGIGRLAISSDGCSELWFSEDGNAFNKRLVAWVKCPAATEGPKPGGFHWSRSQWTDQMNFEEGRVYYIEALHKSSVGHDHFQLAWSLDGFDEVEPLPVASLKPWEPNEEDLNDDGLPDPWQVRHGMEGKVSSAAWQDFDQDGVDNLSEYQQGSDPTDGGGRNGKILWEIWDGLRGRELKDLTLSKAFYGPPDRSMFVEGSVTPKITSGDFGSRLSGFVVPSESATYELAVSGDLCVELWVSSNDSRLNKLRVAYSPNYKNENNWSSSPSQQSKPVVLEAQRLYYFEVLHKDAASPGWAGIAWRKLGEKEFRPIPAHNLKAPLAESKDANRDYLPDDVINEARNVLPQRMRDVSYFTQFGDPDHDGIPNLTETGLGGSIFERDSVSGHWLREWWFLRAGSSVHGARLGRAWLSRPSMVDIFPVGSESGGANFFVSRARGILQIPRDGVYRFVVSGDDQVELWISSNGSKFQKQFVAGVLPRPWESKDLPVWTKRQEWNKRPEQSSAPIRLSAGSECFVEVIQKEGSGDDHFNVGWQIQEKEGGIWGEIQPLPSALIRSFEGDVDDLDDDYLPDSWEKKWGLNGSDNGRGDFKKQGEEGDFDQDGLSNRREFLLGTNPASADSDGDGVEDRDEVETYRSNPNLVDASPPLKIFDFDFWSGSVKADGWMVDNEGGLLSTEHRGAVEMGFSVPKAGVYLLVIHAEVVSPSGYSPPVPVVVSINGSFVGRDELPLEKCSRSYLTQWLAPGEHLVRIENRNFYVGSKLRILGVSLCQHVGEDHDSDSIPDWLESFFTEGGAVGVPPEASQVSPLCLEGTAGRVSDTSVATELGSIDVLTGLSNHWYADIPLDSQRPTTINVQFKGGGESQSFKVRWEETDVFNQKTPIHLRVGDSLLLKASPQSKDSLDGIILINGVGIRTGDLSEGRPLLFDRPGRFVVEAQFRSGPEVISSSFEVHAYTANFGPPISVAAGTKRAWDPPDLDPRLLLESDPLLFLDDQRGEKGGSLLITSLSRVADSQRVIARLPGVGSVVGTADVGIFRIVDSGHSNDARLVSVLADGTRVVEFGITLDGPVPKDLSIWLELYVTDAVFGNGSAFYELTADDFDSNGIARVRVFKAPGSGTAAICHWIRPYGESAGE